MKEAVAKKRGPIYEGFKVLKQSPNANSGLQNAGAG